MMLASVYTKNIRDRTIGALVSGLAVVIVIVFGILVYRGLDDVLADLVAGYPEAMLSMLGLGDSVTGASLVLAELYNIVAPFAIGGLAIAIGAGAIAGEERDGTFWVLMSMPKTRGRVLVSKLAAMVTSLLLATGIILAGSLVSLEATGSEVGGSLLAATTHLFVFSVFLGTLALAIGSATGNPLTASGTSTGVLILSFFGAGLLPLVEGWEWLAKIFPWYYYNASAPLNNGLDPGHVAVLLTASLALAVFAGVSLSRRDLRDGGSQGKLLARLAASPRFAPIAERITGTPLVSSVLTKSISDHRALTVIGCIAVFYLAVLTGPLYNLVSEPLAELADSAPEVLMAMIGFADLSTPEGWLVGEVFAITAPAAMLAVTVSVGVRALAGEERERTLDLLATLPVTRASLVASKAIGLMATAIIVGSAAFAGTALGAALGGLDVSYANIAAISFHLTLFGVLFGLVALALGAVTGKPRLSGAVAGGLALASYVAYAFLPVNPSLAGWVVVSPFHYFLGSDPMSNGFDWGHLAVLAIASALAWVAATWWFDRRDITG